MAPVSETQTLTERGKHHGLSPNDMGAGVKKARNKRNSVDSRGGRKRHAGNLPICQVCFKQGSGFHYGADTCEPCKTFFRRNVALQGKLECRRGNECNPIPSKKFKCTACRLKRCFEVGMSLEGIKLGRYTDTKRAENRAFEAGLKFLSAKSFSIKDPTKNQELHQSLPFLMTPPDTPTDDDVQDQPSPNSDKCPESAKSEDGIRSEINNAINSLLAKSTPLRKQEAESEFSVHGLSPISSEGHVGLNVVLGETESLTGRKQESCVTNAVAPSSQDPSLKQKNILDDVDISVNFASSDLIRNPTENVVRESTQTENASSSLLDTLLYDSMKQQTSVQEAISDSSDFNSSSPLSNWTALGGINAVDLSNPNDSSVCLSNLTDISFNINKGNIDSPGDYKNKMSEIPAATIPLPVSDTTPLIMSMNPSLSQTYNQPSNVTNQMKDTSQDFMESTIPPPISGTTSIFLDTFIDHITNIYNHYDAHGSDFFQQMHRLFFEYLEARSMKKRMFGSLRPLPLPEYRQILMETGLDVDGRLQQLTHRQLPNYEKGYFLYLNFVRDVPGFRDLPMEDQDILIKGARVDYWMLSEFDCFNVEMGLHALPDGFVMGVEDKALVFGRPFIKRMFMAAGRFQKLNLSERERNLLKCIYIFSRGNSLSTPEGIATAEKHHVFFKQVLHYCRQREGRLGVSNEVDRQLDPLMREMGELEEKDWEEFFALWKDFPMIKFPPVTKSFYFGSPTSDHSPVSPPDSF